MTRSGRTALSLALISSIAAALIVAALVFLGVLPPYLRPPLTDADYVPPQLVFERVDFSDIDGWRADDQALVIAVFLRSCARIEALEDDAPVNPLEALGPAYKGASLSGDAADWRAACAAARSFKATRYADGSAAASAARAMFEFNFRALRITAVRWPKPGGPAEGRPAKVSPTGLFTGYFEPSYQASRFRTDVLSAPVYARPKNLVMADLGAFRDDLAGERISGFVEDGTLLPYPDHKAINDGALSGLAEPIAWLAPNDLFFLQIQGSGRLRVQGGTELRVGYDGANGRPYTAVGKVLVDRGEIALENVTMQTIRQWLDAASPDEARAVREANQSYVFFREMGELPDPQLGPIGAEGVQLTASRSLAVDQRYHAMGVPIWLSIPEILGRTPEIRRLFIAQDTGGAIKGPARADIFIGAGDEAGEAAGILRAEGEMIVLVPAAIAERLEDVGAPAAP